MQANVVESGTSANRLPRFFQINQRRAGLGASKSKSKLARFGEYRAGPRGT
jgi:hypothetical protein